VGLIVVIAIVFCLIAFSAVCSGLNIALMSLDVNDLQRKAKLGNALARRVLPLRKNSHLSLAGILLSNVAAVSATSLVLEGQFNGLIAGIASTLLIVVFGEVVPQALFARHALGMVGRFAWLLRLMIGVTYVVSKPLQLLLDRLFGEEASRLQSRHELGMIITEHLGNTTSELDDDEIEIMRGAITLSEKRVRDIMRQIKEVYWLTPNTQLTPAKIDEIKAKGWSRIPIFNRQRTTCFGVLLMKDLVDIDFDTKSYRVDDLPLYPCQVVGSKTALDTMFRKFINGGTHLVPVAADDRIVGIVTIEDLLEEIVGHEIEDETDRMKRRGSNQEAVTEE
jgi:metal transporter CNNM